MPLPALALGAIKAAPMIASGLGAIGGLFGGAKRQRSADRLNREAIGMARKDYADRGFARDRARQMFDAGGPKNAARDFQFSDRLGRAGQRTEGLADRVAGGSSRLPAFRRIGPGGGGGGSAASWLKQNEVSPEEAERRGLSPVDYGPGGPIGMYGAGPGGGGGSGDLDRAREDIAGARAPQFGPVGTGDYSEGRDLTRMGLGDIRRADLPGDYDRVEGGVGREAGRARELASGALEGVVGGQGRGEIADSRFQNLIEKAEDQERLGTQGIGRSAAKFGRMGSGMVTTSLGDLRERTQRGLMQEARGLAADTAEGEIGDRRAGLSAALGAGGQFRGEDQNLRDESRMERAFERGTDSERAQLALSRGGATRGVAGDLTDIASRERGERADDRNFGFNQGQAGADLALRRGRANMDLGQIEFGEGRARRGEERGERDAEMRHALAGAGLDQGALGQISGLEGDIYGREANERGFQNQLYNQDVFSRFGEIDRLSDIGFRPPPVGALMAGAQAESAQGARSAAGAGNLLQSYMQWRQQQGQGGGQTPPIRPIGQTTSQPAYG